MLKTINTFPSALIAAGLFAIAALVYLAPFSTEGRYAVTLVAALVGLLVFRALFWLLARLFGGTPAARPQPGGADRAADRPAP